MLYVIVMILRKYLSGTCLLCNSTFAVDQNCDVRGKRDWWLTASQAKRI